MKKLKALSTAATLGLAAFSFATVQAADFWWTGAAGDGQWSTTNNWSSTDEESGATRLPGTSDMVYYQNWITNDTRIALSVDVSIAAQVGYSAKVSVAGNGHKMTIANGDTWGTEYFGADFTFSGTNSVLDCQGTTANRFKTPIDNGIWAKDGASLSFTTVTLTPNGKFKATNGGKITLPSAAMGSPTQFEADGADSEVKFSNTSTTANSTFRAVNGGKVTLAKWNPAKDVAGHVIEALTNGTFVLTGASSMGNSGNKVDFYMSGAKPTGGFMQVTSGKMELGMGLKLRMTPELSWADDETPIVAYTGTTDTTTIWDDVGLRVDLSKLRDEMGEYDEATLCFYSTKKGTIYMPTDNVDTVKFNNKTDPSGVKSDLRTEWKLEGAKSTGMKLYLRVFRHNWDSGVVAAAPTRHQNARKTYHCTDPGCTCTKTVAVPNTKLPGDYLKTDGVGYYELKNYFPNGKKTFVEMKLRFSDLAANRDLAWASDDSEWGTTFWASGGIQYYSNMKNGTGEHGCTVVDGFTDTKHAHVVKFGGNQTWFDDAMHVGEANADDIANEKYLTLFWGSGWRKQLMADVYYIKIWEQDGETQTLKYWCVPYLSGTTATLLDLVSEKSITPSKPSGKTVNFTIGTDPSGLMLFLR